MWRRHTQHTDKSTSRHMNRGTGQHNTTEKDDRAEANSYVPNPALAPSVLAVFYMQQMKSAGLAMVSHLPLLVQAQLPHLGRELVILRALVQYIGRPDSIPQMGMHIRRQTRGARWRARTGLRVRARARMRLRARKRCGKRNGTDSPSLAARRRERSATDACARGYDGQRGPCARVCR